MLNSNNPNFSIKDIKDIKNINDIYQIPLDDPETWRIISEGKTVGGFQIESPLLRTWCRKLEPKSIQELADVISIVRPGVLNSKDERGFSMAEVYRLRKFKLEPYQYIHDSLEPALKGTYSVLVYQESLSKIAVDVAGFNLVEADELRKGVSKKIPQEVARIKNIFIDKAEQFGVVDRETATKIYESFEASARYLFCQAHAVGYAITAYLSMYMKANYTKKFVCSWLKNSIDSPDTQDDVAALVADARYSGIDIMPPCLLTSGDNFKIIDDKIWFGINNIKGIGEAQVPKIRTAISKAEQTLNKKLKEFSYLEILFYLDVSPSVKVKLANSGAFRFLNIERKKMVHEINNIKKPLLTDGEARWCRDNLAKHDNLISLLTAMNHLKKAGGGLHETERQPKVKSIIDILRNPPIDLTDYSDEIAKLETELLGVALSCSRLDKFDNATHNSTLAEFIEGKNMEFMTFGVEIIRIGCYIIKKGASIGREMAFVSAKDNSATCDDIVIFADTLDMLRDQNLIYQGARLLIQGTRDTQRGSLIIQKAKLLRNI
jgi:DNA polymerase III alpha subunit